MADIFVSYTSSDKEWAEWIGHALRELNHIPHLHDWEICAGDDIMAWMVERHNKADFVLGLVSDEWLRAAYSQLERMAGEWAAAKSRPHFMRYVVVRPAKLPTIGDHRNRIEIFGVPDAVKKQRLKDYLEKPQRPPPPHQSPDPGVAVSNITARVPEHFLGRDDSMAAIETALVRYQGRVAITALHGLQGVGKTALAAAYAQKHRGDYRATWWIRAQSPEGMRADLFGLGVRLRWVAPDEKEAPAVKAVMERLLHEGEGILLIYDNAIDADMLRPYLPQGAAKILVTSNAHAWRGLAEPVEILLWPKEIGADYLIARTGRREERAQAEALSAALGGLPLAHEQAGAYCERLGVGLGDYLKRLNAAPLKLLDAEKDAAAEYHDKITVAKTFALAIEEATKLHPGAARLIEHAALLAAEPIPLFFLEQLWGALPSPALAGEGGRRPDEGSTHGPSPDPASPGHPLPLRGRGETPDDLEEAVAALRSFALVDLEEVKDERDPSQTTKCVKLHRLLRIVAAARLQGAAREAALLTLLEAMAAVYPDSDAVFIDSSTWPTARRIDGLACALLNDGELPCGAEESAAHLLSACESFRHGALADYAGALKISERALKLFEQVWGLEHPNVAMAVNNLAYIYMDIGDLGTARALFERALAVCEKAKGIKDTDTVKCMNNLGLLLLELNELSTARSLFEQALKVREELLGIEHPHTAQSANNLALVLRDQGHYSEARLLHERALACWEKVYGPEHSETAASLNNLALLLCDISDFAAARPLYERALAIREKALGPEHPNTNLTRRHLARLLLKTGDASAALPLAETALKAHAHILGPAHPWTKGSARMTADALKALGRFEEAQALRARFGLEG